MLIKIKDEGEKWFLIDNAENVQVDHTTHEFSGEDEVYQLARPGSGVHVYHIIGRGAAKNGADGPLRAAVIRFERAGKQYLVALATFAYICNDGGRTVERVTVN